MYKLGVDLGGTKIEAILLDENFNVIKRKRIPTPQNDYQKILDSISSLVVEISENISDYSLGVCTPGAISKQTGLIKNSNTQCLIGKSLKEDLENKTEKKVFMENDANCFALAEATLGIAMDFDSVFGVILGTGVGGGIIINKKLYPGRTNIGGEWGHHTLHRNGNPCYCGKTGCVETYISGPSLENHWTELTGKSQSLPEILTSTNNDNWQKWKNELFRKFWIWSCKCY